jgi:hypothetical protein
VYPERSASVSLAKPRRRHAAVDKRYRSRDAAERPSFAKRHNISLVTTGLDPVVHAELQRRKPSGLNQFRCRMDCRIKSGNDERENERKAGKRNADRRSVS